MSDILDQAKGIQRRAALDQQCWVTLAFIEDMIAEIERLRALARLVQVDGIEPPPQGV